MKSNINTDLILRQKSDYIISNKPIPTEGFFCIECDKEQPLYDYMCLMCACFTPCGDLYNDEVKTPKDHIKWEIEFKSQITKILTFEGMTNNRNYIYKRCNISN